MARTRRIALRTSRQCRRLSTSSTASRSSCSTAWHLDDMGRGGLLGWGERGGRSPVLNQDWGEVDGGGHWEQKDWKTLPAVPSAVVPGAAVGIELPLGGRGDEDGHDGETSTGFSVRVLDGPCAVVDTPGRAWHCWAAAIGPLARGTWTESELRLRIA